MPQDDDDPPSARRDMRRAARRERTRSPAPKEDDELDKDKSDDGGATTGAAPRRRSTINFSADKLLESLKEASEKSDLRLQRVPTITTGEGTTARSAPSGRRPPARTMSAQAARSYPRRTRSGGQDGLSQSVVDSTHEMDGSSFSHLSSSDRRMRLPQRARSAQDAVLPRGPMAQRTRAGRKKPDREEDAADEIGGSSRRRPPPRTRSAEAGTPRAAMRSSRSGRRRPSQGNDDEDECSDDVVISDSEDDMIDNSRASGHDNTDRSTRRRMPPRARSTDGGIPTTRGARTSRAHRRRPSGCVESSDASPRRTGPGPALMRSSTAIQPASGAGPGLMRTNTQTNPRSNRVRGGRNTAQELAQVTAAQRELTAAQRERSPDPFDEELEPPNAKDALRQKNSVSPIKSRQERRRLREDKEREALDRRMQGVLAANYDDEVEPPVVEKKEEPWMRRLKKKGGKANDDSCGFEEAAARHDALHNSVFAVDPSFGVFAAEPVTHLDMSSLDYDIKNEDALLSTAANDKLDFSTIS